MNNTEINGGLTMNILSIGNSFSQDATRYLHEIAKAENVHITTVNLMIGGCSLNKHYKNMMADSKSYMLEYNGESTDFFVSMKEALVSRTWDFVTMQQVSHESVNYQTFQPYLNEISNYVKKMAPEAKQVIHQTWAYEAGSNRLCNELKYNTDEEMLCDIRKSYKKACSDIGATFVIPSGELINKISKNGINAYRDTYHATLGAGRYALGLLWYYVFTGNIAKESTFKFNASAEIITSEEENIVRKCVEQVCSETI